MDTQKVRWEHYALIAAHPAARAFVERLVLQGKRPKTVDAYARSVEDLLMYFAVQAMARHWKMRQRLLSGRSLYDQAGRIDTGYVTKVGAARTVS